jgi:methyl acetate hydrolase
MLTWVPYMQTKSVPGIISCQNAALALPLVFDPGDRRDYGIGIDRTGKAVERVSGQALGEISTSICSGRSA